MGRVLSAGDNAVMESFFALLRKNVPNRRPAADPLLRTERSDT
jgi:hypothetical protein